MPMPEPRKDEEEKDFISRCMGNDTMKKEYPEQEQRTAVCYSQWRKEHPESKKLGKSEETEQGKSESDGQPQKKTPRQKQIMIPAEREEKPSSITKMRAAPMLEGKVAQLDPGWIEGYAAVFNNVDQVGDRILPGAFTKTIKQRMAAGKVHLMALHLRDGGGARDVIGTVTRAKEDDIGLWQHAVLSRTRTAQEIRQNVLDGHIGGFSIGYITKDAEMTEVEGKAVRDLKELAWYETTVTTIEVNELALITAAKAEAALEREPAGEVSDPLQGKLDANRDEVQAKAAEVDILLANRMELLDTDSETEETDTDADHTAQDTEPNPMAEALQRMKMDLEELVKDA